MTLSLEPLWFVSGVMGVWLVLRRLLRVAASKIDRFGRDPGGGGGLRGCGFEKR